MAAIHTPRAIISHFLLMAGYNLQGEADCFISKTRVILGDNETIERVKYSCMLYVVMGSRRGTTL